MSIGLTTNFGIEATPISNTLIPTIGRRLSYAGAAIEVSYDVECSLLHRFRRRVYPYIGRVITAGEAIFLARHYGLPTRLLDWTANALFALYFACVSEQIEDQNKDGKVWAMLRWPASEDHDLDAFVLARLEDEASLFNYVANRNSDELPNDELSHAIRIVHPLYNSPRLVAQDGAFTIHSHPRNSIEWCRGKLFRRRNLDIASLYWWRIPSKYKPAIVRELSGLGITHRTLFPDLDGVARSLWETEVLWNGNRDRSKAGQVKQP